MDSRQIQPGGVGDGRGRSDSGQIKADIDHTRGRIDETLDALADKLHAKHLLDEAVDYLRTPGQVSGTASKLGQTVWHQIQEHPMPSLLIGAGIAWMLSERKQAKTETRAVPGSSWSDDEGDGAEWGDEASSAYSEAGEPETGPSIGEKTAAFGQSVKAKTEELAQSVREKSGEIAHRIKEKTHTIKEKSAEQAMRIKEATTSMRRQTRDRAGELVQRAEQSLHEATHNYPLAMGFGFLAVGVLAGLALPHSRIEDETLGERADELKEKVRDQGRQVIETAQRTATAVANAATEEAQKVGLTPQTLGEKIQHVASETARAAADAAHREGLDQQTLTQQAQTVASEAKRAAKQELGQSKESRTT